MTNRTIAYCLTCETDSIGDPRGNCPWCNNPLANQKEPAIVPIFASGAITAYSCTYTDYSSLIRATVESERQKIVAFQYTSSTDLPIAVAAMELGDVTIMFAGWDDVDNIRRALKAANVILGMRLIDIFPFAGNACPQRGYALVVAATLDKPKRHRIKLTHRQELFGIRDEPLILSNGALPPVGIADVASSLIRLADHGHMDADAIVIDPVAHDASVALGGLRVGLRSSLLCAGDSDMIVAQILDDAEENHEQHSALE